MPYQTTSSSQYIFWVDPYFTFRIIMPFRKSCLTIRLPQGLPFIGQYIFWVGPHFTFRIIMPFRKSCLTIRLPQGLPFIGQYIFWVDPHFTFRIIMPFRKSCLTIRLPQVLPFMIYLNISDVYETGTLKLSSLKWKKCLKRFRVTYTAHGKRQAQVANQSQNGKWADKNSPKQFFWVAMTLNYLFLCRGNNWKNS